MSEAKVRSIEALNSFRSSLIVFRTKARRALDQAGEEVHRSRNWLQNDQKLHWQTELRRRTRAMEQAEQELVTARFSTLRNSTTMQEAAVRKARLSVQEAEEKIRHIKTWSRQFDSLVDPFLKKIESLRSYIDNDLPKAIAFLTNAEFHLLAYAESAAAVPLSAPPASETPPPSMPASSFTIPNS